MLKEYAALNRKENELYRMGVYTTRKVERRVIAPSALRSLMHETAHALADKRQRSPEASIALKCGRINYDYSRVYGLRQSCLIPFSAARSQTRDEPRAACARR
ncbi:hypothetical protein EVAR_58042_1 [Eumeta japonica]|uniref:Uncharacterized protein n=1 Tax=Eumeta variegata TaxID=151549 RepID=A0A4C1Z2F0_EUMVA|nr:hypothetical protein EVAR_58042_1 [Eumeta japonica]